jgi:hypothetical protein
MTDLDATASGTLPCPACGAQNAGDALHCSKCGAELTVREATDAERGDLELEEAWRAASAEGFDVDFRVLDGDVTCTNCGADLPLPEAVVRWWRARDTSSNRSEVVVAGLRCPVCETLGRAEVPPSSVVPSDEDEDAADVDPTEVPWRRAPPDGSTPEHPLGEDRQFFEPAEPGSLRDQGPLVDAEGEDVRQYTGEPVETEEGWVLPQQQNVGPGNEAGGGEWPDPATPSAMPSDDASER